MPGSEATVAAPPDLQAVRQLFVDELEASAPVAEASDSIPEEALARFVALGICALTVPPELGGLGLTPPQALPYLELAGMGPAWSRMLAHVGNGIWRPIARYGSEEQRALIARMAAGEAVVAFALTERTGGTGRDLHSRAVRDGDVWRLTGEKHLITFADRADSFLLTAAGDERRAADSLTSFLLPRDTPGLEMEASQHTMGLAGTGHRRLRFDGMAVDDRHRLGPVGAGLEVAMSFLDYSRVSLSACMVGTAQRALDEAVAFARRRVTFGRPIADRQAIQVHLADMHADVAAARALVREAAHAPEGAASATAKLFCQNMVGRVTDLALRVHGGLGYTTATPIERLYRDARGYWFEEGTAEIQQLVIARHLLGA
ncbi:MAG TPA: acyl-CoA dehydrogenase family protein [Solirubrobacteraceae bacterium]|jgi:alkylation response protein AidB-like acyl-CoA dehydrogenase